ncbi:hypothetical protein [Aquibacillus kalidii]|uniref:hypothetical protein n=1 Tax=Aquibacillus kalidii TaxID=2762597 RepID=UPI0016441CD7|nr:hypothetical protein [Aquibacillus kalidii]
MQLNKNFKKRYLITFSILLLLLLSMYFAPSVFGGYALTEHSAIRYTLPNLDGKVVFEKELVDKKIVVLDTGKVNYVKLIENSLGIFKRITDVSSISGKTIDEKMKVTWSGTEIEESEFYDVIFAAGVIDKEIEKVVVSNEQDDKKNTPLSIVEEQSTVFIEMDVKDGFAAHYSKLSNENVGSFSFRGINSDGKVVSFD